MAGNRNLGRVEACPSLHGTVPPGQDAFRRLANLNVPMQLYPMSRGLG